jgi:hypothetical protein
MKNVKIEEQTNVHAAELEVRQNLGFVDRGELVHGLQLDDYTVFHEQIDPVADVDPDAVVQDRLDEFRQDLQAAFAKLVNKAALVCAFQKSRAKRGMNFHHGVDDLTRNLIDVPHDALLHLSVEKQIAAAISQSNADEAE